MPGVCWSIFRPAGIGRTEFACGNNIASTRISDRMEPLAVPSGRKSL
jgi:hypothetical protein